MTIDVVKRMKEITLMMQTPEQVLEAQGVTSADLEGMLDELQEHVESIDMANDLHSIGGFPPLLNYLKNSHANIQAKAAEVVTTIVQNNPKNQQLVMEANGLEYKFLATEESYAHPIYKRKLVEYDRTAYTDIFGHARWPGAPHRVLETPFFDEWKSLPDHETEANQPVIGRTRIHDREIEICCLAGIVPNVTTTGDIESMVFYAGQSVGLLDDSTSMKRTGSLFIICFQVLILLL